MLKHFRSNLLMGLIVLLPTIATIYVLQFLFNLVDRVFGKWLTLLLIKIGLLPQEFHFTLFGMSYSDRLPGIGFVVTLIFLIIVGMVTKSFVGRQLFRLYEYLFSRIPIARSIYSTVKQILNAFTQDRSSFKKVVLAEYPRKGLYTVGFLTGEHTGEAEEKLKKDLLTIFFPTTPNPTSGWLALVPKEDVIFLEMKVEDGLKFIISGGVVIPSASKEEAVTILERTGNLDKEEQIREQEIEEQTKLETENIAREKAKTS